MAGYDRPIKEHIFSIRFSTLLIFFDAEYETKSSMSEIEGDVIDVLVSAK